MIIIKTKIKGRMLVFILISSLFVFLSPLQNDKSLIQATTDTYTEDFSTTIYMDGVKTNTSGWGTGNLENSKKKPIVVGSISSALIGNPLDVFIDEDFAYVTNQNEGLKVVNITDLTNPFIIGTYDTADIAQSVFVSGEYAYIADYVGDGFFINFQVVNIIDPSNPISTGNCTTYGLARDVVVEGNYAFVANDNSGLCVIDITDPSNPSRATWIDTPGTSLALTIKGNYAYLADGANGLVVVNVTDPLNLDIIATFSTGISSATSIVVEANYAYVIDINNGVIVVNVTDPTTPSFVSSWNKNGASNGYIERDYLYVTDVNDGLSVVNITDPNMPSFIHTISLSGIAQSIVIDGNYAYLACQTGGFQIVEITDPSPVLIDSYNTPGLSQDVLVSGDLAFVADAASGLQILDISNPTSTSYIGSYNTPGYAYDVFISGNYAYIADGIEGLQIVNISIPSSPTIVGSYTTPDYAFSVFVSGDYAYVGTDYLEIFDISDPSSPVNIETFSPGPGVILDIFISGDFAYTASEVGLDIVDISDPFSPSLVSPPADDPIANSVYVSGDIAYLAGENSGLTIVNVSDPSSPVDIGSYNPPGSEYGVYVSDNFAYLATYYNGLHVFEISDPTHPTYIGFCDTPDRALGVYVSGNYAYVADYGSGMQVLELSKHYASQFDSPCIAQSTTIFTASSSSIVSATLTAIDTVPASTAVTYYLSADTGVNWELVTPGVQHDFINIGDQLKWRAVLSTFIVLRTPVIHNLSITYTTELFPPSLNTPIDGYLTDHYTPTFTWSDTIGETAYLFQLDTSTSFTTPLINITLPSSSLSYTPSSELAPDTYYWRVAGIDTENDIGAFSNYRSIIIFEDTAVPIIDHPIDVIYEVGDIGNYITWNPSDTNPYYYNITRNTTVLEQGISWDGSSITIDVDGLAEGVYNFTCYAYDREGLFAWDSVIVTVEIPVIGEFTFYSMLSVMFVTITLVVIYLNKKRKTRKNN